jgi:hypothetical protein
MTKLAPNETVVGDDAAAMIASLRADASVLLDAHPDHTFRSAEERMISWQTRGVDVTVFSEGLREAKERFAGLGLSQMLPLGRVLVGAESRRSGAVGGFHHSDQGYRHLQMVSVITMHGSMELDAPQRSDLALLDLLRAYAHDCLHYGSRRRYVNVGGELVRTQYGINFRRVSGRSYSAVDPDESISTRNLGVVMEGACDREARRITHLIAQRSGIAEPDDAFGRLSFRDATGTLSPEDINVVTETLSGEYRDYVRAMGWYDTNVNRRYARFLEEFAPGEEAELHQRILHGVISGETRDIDRWLNARHGPGAFAGTFMSETYLA